MNTAKNTIGVSILKKAGVLCAVTVLIAGLAIPASAHGHGGGHRGRGAASTTYCTSCESTHKKGSCPNYCDNCEDYHPGDCTGSNHHGSHHRG